MKNFIFKSSARASDFHKILFNKLDMLLAEQRHQRQDLVIILTYCKTLQSDKNLQRQVDEYFEDDETSPQTEPEEQKVTNLDSNFEEA